MNDVVTVLVALAVFGVATTCIGITVWKVASWVATWKFWDD